MKIEQGNNNELVIFGNIKSIEDGITIKNALQALQESGVRTVHLKIQDSFSMTSTVIGHLMKLVNLDKTPVSLAVGDRRLYQLLEDLSLVQMLNVRLIGE